MRRQIGCSRLRRTAGPSTAFASRTSLRMTAFLGGAGLRLPLRVSAFRDASANWMLPAQANSRSFGCVRFAIFAQDDSVFGRCRLAAPVQDFGVVGLARKREIAGPGAGREGFEGGAAEDVQLTYLFLLTAGAACGWSFWRASRCLSWPTAFEMAACGCRLWRSFPGAASRRCAGLR
jgi:hypothetical protein